VAAGPTGPTPLKADRACVDALPMATEYRESEQRVGAARSCPDCGRPMGEGTDASYRICQDCYDAYVDNAGR
jgi:hypothetical protein